MSAASTKTQDPSMDEILASIRRIIADDQDAPKTPDRDATETGRDDEVLDLADVPESRIRPPADLDVEVPELSFQSAAETRQPEVVSAPVPRPEPEPAPPAKPASAAAEPPSRSLESLISSETTASVSHAFNLLSHTILTQNARTLEDLVGEMLKPMLKVWLDDNLPPLVERLVRAEIERVARGSR